MLKAFNSLQITALFAAFPYGIQWLAGAEFPEVMAARVVAIATYVVGFFAMAACVADAIDHE